MHHYWVISPEWQGFLWAIWSGVALLQLVYYGSEWCKQRQAVRRAEQLRVQAEHRRMLGMDREPELLPASPEACFWADVERLRLRAQRLAPDGPLAIGDHCDGAGCAAVGCTRPCAAVWRRLTTPEVFEQQAIVAADTAVLGMLRNTPLTRDVVVTLPSGRDVPVRRGDAVAEHWRRNWCVGVTCEPRSCPNPCARTFTHRRPTI